LLSEANNDALSLQRVVNARIAAASVGDRLSAKEVQVKKDTEKFDNLKIELESGIAERKARPFIRIEEKSGGGDSEVVELNTSERKNIDYNVYAKEFYEKIGVLTEVIASIADSEERPGAKTIQSDLSALVTNVPDKEKPAVVEELLTLENAYQRRVGEALGLLQRMKKLKYRVEVVLNEAVINAALSSVAFKFAKVTSPDEKQALKEVATSDIRIAANAQVAYSIMGVDYMKWYAFLINARKKVVALFNKKKGELGINMSAAGEVELDTVILEYNESQYVDDGIQADHLYNLVDIPVPTVLTSASQVQASSGHMSSDRFIVRNGDKVKRQKKS
jgi:hypothetical protein